jgi:hypothetical protein
MKKAPESMKLRTGIVLYLTLVCFQTKQGLRQETKSKGILKSLDMQWIENEQPKLVLKNYLKMAMLNQAWILLQS